MKRDLIMVSGNNNDASHNARAAREARLLFACLTLAFSNGTELQRCVGTHAHLASLSHNVQHLRSAAPADVLPNKLEDGRLEKRAGAGTKM